MDWINDLLSNKKLLRNIKTGISLSFPFILIFIYWGFIKGFRFEGFNYETITALTIIFTLSIYIVRIDIKSRAKEDEIEESCVEVENEISDIKFDIKDDSIGMKYITELNKRIQDNANQFKTEKHISELEFRKRKRIIKGKPTIKIDEEIEKLKKVPLIDNKVTPINYSDLIYASTNRRSKKDILDGKGLNYDPAKDGNIRSLGATFVKGVGAGSVGLVWLMNEPVANVLAYLGVLIIGIISTVVTQYPLTRYLTKTKYLDRRKRKLNLIKDMQKYIAKNIEQQKED